jgi:hypothetical protein
MGRHRPERRRQVTVRPVNNEDVMPNKFVLLAILPGLVMSSAIAADRFSGFNNTTSTVFVGVYLAPAGTAKWGPNEALNDKDKVWDTGERLVIKSISRGTFELKVVDRSGRICIKHGVDLTKETSFEIRDDDLRGCKK